MSDVLAVGVVVSALAQLLAVGLLVVERLGGRELPGPRHWPAVFVASAAGVAAWRVTHDPGSVLLVAGLLAAVATALVARLSRFFVSGALVLATNLTLAGFALPWAGWFLLTMPVSATTRALASVGYALALVGMPVMLVRNFENLEVLCRREWRRPRHPLPRPGRRQWPRVAVQVAAHAEPPDVVIATLESLARLDYPNFEVMVIDNNTADEALWRPVAARCAELGERFRFFHVEGITGAKAGALNFALVHTAAEVELVAVVDADYQVEPDFLAATVAHFDDPTTGFVQGPHAYRDWGDSAYLRMCAFEYA